MDYSTFTIIAAFILAFGLISGRLEKTVITAPMVFVVFGFLMSSKGFGLFDLDAQSEVIKVLAELTLILVLFTDATMINLRVLRREFKTPLRLLGIGMPLTIILGALVAAAMFTHLNFWEAAVVAAMLAPTDAALGKAVVTSKRIPLRIRQTLNIESGLNDGMALPIVLIFLALAGVVEQTAATADWLTFIAKQIVLGPLVGVMVGYGTGKMVHYAIEKEWMNHKFHQIAAVAMALLVYMLADMIGGNGFIAAFCAGLVTGSICRNTCGRMYEFAEAEGELLELLTFLIFGNIMLCLNVQHIDWNIILYAVLSLTVIRMVPVAISLIGLRFRWDTVLFLGWFGPRGIASILFGILVLEQMSIANRQEIYLIVIGTVFVSIFAHGLTALPCANFLANRLKNSKEENEMPECASCVNIRDHNT